MTSWRGSWFAWALVAWALAGAPRADAGVLSRMEGHLGLGYARLFVADSPGGSLSATAGLDLPIARELRVGPAIGYHFLGSRTVEGDFNSATVEYTAFEVALLAHWQPVRLGPLARVSVGPALVHGRGELSVSSGGAEFQDHAFDETAPGAALDLTLLRRSPSPVRAGLEVGTRLGFLERETWTIVGARLVVVF